METVRNLPITLYNVHQVLDAYDIAGCCIVIAWFRGQIQILTRPNVSVSNALPLVRKGIQGIQAGEFLCECQTWLQCNR